MKKISICVVVTCLFSSVSAFADNPGPSFDCIHTRSAQEDIICDSDDLSAMDLKLFNTYQALLNQLPSVDADQVRADQTAWLKKRNKTCKKSLGDYADGCIRESYIARQKELDSLAKTFNVTP